MAHRRDRGAAVDGRRLWAGGRPATVALGRRIAAGGRVGRPDAHAGRKPDVSAVTLADLVGLADRGADRRFIGMEGQSLGPGCNRAWMRVDEPAGLAPQQMAEDLLKVSIERFAFQKSCGALIFGTTDRTVCNCYHAEHGYLEIDRGPVVEPAPGKMLVYFALNDTDSSPSDWSVTVDAPTG